MACGTWPMPGVLRAITPDKHWGKNVLAMIVQAYA